MVLFRRNKYRKKVDEIHLTGLFLLQVIKESRKEKEREADQRDSKDKDSSNEE